MIRPGILFLFTFLTILSAKGQKTQTIESVWANKIQIDGDLEEWGDSLTHYFDNQDFHYSFANDDNYLYIAIRVKNKERQLQAVFNGFKVSINSNNKKKKGPSLIFPMPDRAALRALSNQEFDKETDPVKRAISSTRAYYVQDFKTILDGPISLENNYGIEAAVFVDSLDNLCYESAIRLDQLNLPNKDGLTINLKINGLIRTQYTDHGMMRNRRGSPYGRSNYGYDQRPRTIIREREEEGIWQYLNLAKP